MPRQLEPTLVWLAVGAALGASVGALAPAIALVLIGPAIAISAPRSAVPVLLAAAIALLAAVPLAREGEIGAGPVLSLLEVAALVAVLRAASQGASLSGWRALHAPVGVAFAATPFLLLGSIPLARAVAGPGDPRVAISASRGFSIAAPLSPTSPLVLLTTAAAGVGLGRYILTAAPLALGLLARECIRDGGRPGARQAVLAVVFAAPSYPAMAIGVALIPGLTPVQLLLIAGLAVVVLRRRGFQAVGDEWALFGTAGLVSAVAVGHDLAGHLGRSVFSMVGPVAVVALAGATVFLLYQVGIHPVLGAPVIAASAAQLGGPSVAVVLAVVACGAAAGTVSRFSGQSHLSRVDRPACSHWAEQGQFAMTSSALAIGWGLAVTSWL